jgi:tol-pal system protein YbgF
MNRGTFGGRGVSRATFPLRLGAAALVAVWLVPLAARAALWDDEEARRRIEQTNLRVAQVQKQLEDRVAALELQLKNQGLVELFGQVEQLKSDVARLRGQIEVLNHEQDQLQKRQRDLYIDLDSRLRRLEGGPGANVPPASSGAPAPGPAAAAPPAPGPAVAAPPTTGATPGATAPSTGTGTGTGAADAAAIEQRAYDVALDQFKAGNYPAAIASFNAFVKNYGKSPLAPSAYYWIGNSQFALKDYRAAIATQRQLVAAFPGNPKVPDALLNIATSQFELGDGAASRRTLEELIAKHPQSEAAVKARQRLAIR